MRYENWEINGFDRDSAVSFCKRGINPLVSVFLTSRGINDIGEVKAILRDTPSNIFDPYLMTDMDKAVARINAAVENHERIAIYGDYDVDGMTSCAILALWLRSKGADFEIYIPGRFGEGYGLNCSAIDTLKSRDVNLIVTVDCGITAIAVAEYTRDLGISLVITDHHECKDTLPVADAVVDPMRPDCAYPHKTLAGAGVAFKLACALEKDTSVDDMLMQYGDLVALGTVADVMPVTGENRELIKRGLRVLNHNPRPGLSCLLRDTGVEYGKVDTAVIGFMLAPRLNAAGRMGRTEVAVDLILAEDKSEADRLTEELSLLNTERRKIETEIYEEAEAMYYASQPDGGRLILLAKHGWYQGVTGIVAAKMAERFLTPTIIISIDDDGIARGSCRSIAKFGMYSALRTCEDILIDYGGHEMAAGVTVAQENIDQLRKRLDEYYLRKTTDVPSRNLKLDFEVEKPELLTAPNVEALEDLEPFGRDNLPPLLYIGNARLTFIQSIGLGKHSRLRIEKLGKTIDCIFFAAPLETLGVVEGDIVDIAFEPQINEFRGRSSVQLHIRDIRVAHHG